MIEHAWTVLCQKSIIDQDTNNISLDVLEQLSVKNFIFPEKAKGIILPIQIEIVSLWYRIKACPGLRGRAQQKIIASNGEEVGRTEIEIDLLHHQRYRSRVRLNGLPLPKDSSSDYFYFVIELEKNNKWVEVARLPLEVERQSPQ